MNKLINLIIFIISVVQKNKIFYFACLLTIIFYWPSLKHGSVNAGFLYTGDVLGWYLPSMAKIHMLIHEFNLFAIDYSTFNGSSDFFFSPNLFSVHPIIVFFSILIPPETISLKQYGHFFVLFMALHSFLAIYYSLKLFTRFFNFEFGAAALTATVFGLSMHMLNSLGQPVFLLCSSITPWAAYAALTYVDKPNLRVLIYSCLPFIFGLLGGYLPLAVACLVLSFLFVAIKLLYIDDSISLLNKRIGSMFISLFPCAIALVIVGPFIYSIIEFHKETSSAGSGSLFYSAYQYAQLPQNLLTIFSSHFFIPGPESEFTVLWGFIFIVVAAIFLLGNGTLNTLTSKEWKLFNISAIIYFAIILSTFGEFSVVSDLVYYFVPQVGRMHVYQRFFLPAELAFGVIFALMLKSVINARPTASIKVALIIMAIATLLIAYLVAFKIEISREIGLNNFLVVELFIGFLFTCALMIPSKKFIYIASITLFCLRFRHC